MSTGPALQARDQHNYLQEGVWCPEQRAACCTSTRQIPPEQIPSASSLGLVVDECIPDLLALCSDLWEQTCVEGSRSWPSRPARYELNPHLEPHFSNTPGCPWPVPSAPPPRLFAD